VTLISAIVLASGLATAGPAFAQEPEPEPPTITLPEELGNLEPFPSVTPTVSPGNEETAAPTATSAPAEPPVPAEPPAAAIEAPQPAPAAASSAPRGAVELPAAGIAEGETARDEGWMMLAAGLLAAGVASLFARKVVLR
jgi:hypothetical protein